MQLASQQDVRSAQGQLSLAHRTGLWKSFTAGLVAGVANVLVSHPLDTLKVRLQVSRSREALRVAGLYRGATGPLVTTPWLAAANFGIWDAARVELTLCFPLLFARHPDKVLQTSCSESASNAWAIFLAGVCSGWVLCNLTCPVHNLKVQQQTGNVAKGLLPLAREVGPGGLFRGYLPHAFVESVGRGWYMLGFVLSKRALGLGDANSETSGGLGQFGRRVVCGCAGGGLAWLMVYPLDVMRNRLMWDWRRERYSGLWDCVRQSFRQDGVLGFYRGLSYSLIRALPVAAVTLPTYDWVLHALDG